MLEHAEVAIAESESLAKSSVVDKQNRHIRGVKKIINELKKIWPEDKLPHDIKRLAETIYEIICACDLTENEFEKIIIDEKNRYKILPDNLSPYSFTIQALAHSNSVNFREKLGRDKFRTKIVIHDGMELPEWIQRGHSNIIKIA